MNILVIGSQGFIGKYVTKYLEVISDYCVYGCDVVNATSANYIQLDSGSIDIAKLLQQVSFNVCINCSGAASVPASIIDPRKDYTLNTSNVFYILDAIRQYLPQCKFINLSSAAVYGNPKEIPTSEACICAPISPYGYHKLMAEQLCYLFYEQFGLSTCSIRIFSAYGPGLKKQLFWDIFQKAKGGTRHIELYGTGEESRDFIHVLDIAESILIIIKNAEFKGSIYNVANGVSIAIKEAVAQLLKALNYKGEVTFGGQVRIGDPINWCSNIDKIKTLGYTTSKYFEEGVLDTAAWLKKLD